MPRTSKEIFSENLRNKLFAKKEIKFTTNWKSLYEELDAEHRRAFWRGLIRGVEIDRNGFPVKILY